MFTSDYQIVQNFINNALCQAKRAPRAAFPSGCLAAQKNRWAEGIRVPAPLAGRGLPGAPQDEAGLTRKFETSHVGGATG